MMIFEIHKASEWSYRLDTYCDRPCLNAFPKTAVNTRGQTVYFWAIKLNSLKDLKELQNETGHPLVVDYNDIMYGSDTVGTIIIYDDYIE